MEREEGRGRSRHTQPNVWFLFFREDPPLPLFLFPSECNIHDEDWQCPSPHNFPHDTLVCFPGHEKIGGGEGLGIKKEGRRKKKQKGVGEKKKSLEDVDDSRQSTPDSFVLISFFLLLPGQEATIHADQIPSTFALRPCSVYVLSSTQIRI